jgi:hypothetical protein
MITIALGGRDPARCGHPGRTAGSIRIEPAPSPVRNASSSSDTADRHKAIGEVPFSECLAVHTEGPADGPYIVGAAPLTSKPHHFPGRLPCHLAIDRHPCVD